jgi:aminopeptidase N
MKTRNLLICLLLLDLFAGCSRRTPSLHAADPGKGVTLELARQRKQQLGQIHYDLVLEIPNASDPIQATEKITFQLASNANALQLDFQETREHLQSLRVNGKETPIDYRNEHLVLPASSLVAGSNAVEIRLIAGDASLNRKAEFLYSLFVPDRARTFVPCFDQPDLKATFQLTATVPADWQTISNASLREKTVSGNQATYHFNNSDTISTYLFSIVAGQFEHVSRKIGRQEVHFYYRETNADKLRYSVDTIFEQHRQSLEFMEAYTGIPYPFEKFDLIAIPDFQYGGMEHAGAIDYKASLLFLDQSATPTEKADRLNTIAHETAHMWFGNLVTMEWFNDVWMKEVFANFMADKISDAIQPDAHQSLRFLLHHHPSAYAIDRTAGANPVRQQLDNLDQAGTLYGDIIYHKAPIVMQQLEQLCGADKLQQGLRTYLKTYSFGNASWPKLIEILDPLTTENLASWNQQWINRAGRPELDYRLATDAGKIRQLTLLQNNPGDWKQHFSLAFVYADRTETIPVYMNSRKIQVPGVRGKQKPLFIVFNAGGAGYGAFPVDPRLLDALGGLSPVMRATSYLNAYEKTLNGDGITPQELLVYYAANFSSETEELIVQRRSKQFRNIYWQFLTDSERVELHPGLEKQLWQAIENGQSAGKKRTLFQLYAAIALSSTATEQLYDIWRTREPGAGLVLSDEDYILLAAELALRGYHQTPQILEVQLGRIQNPDRRKGFAFASRALSSDIAVRDAFFASLADPRQRENETWVTEGLSYLHHPLRAGTSEKYLPQTLALLEEVQRTGDIFFPSAWLRSSLGYYRSKNAADIVHRFLREHPDYNPNLRRKVLQEADDLFRAAAAR